MRVLRMNSNLSFLTLLSPPLPLSTCSNLAVSRCAPAMLTTSSRPSPPPSRYAHAHSHVASHAAAVSPATPTFEHTHSAKNASSPLSENSLACSAKVYSPPTGIDEFKLRCSGDFEWFTQTDISPSLDAPSSKPSPAGSPSGERASEERAGPQCNAGGKVTRFCSAPGVGCQFFRGGFFTSFFHLPVSTALHEAQTKD